MSKRGPIRQMDHSNWDQEEEPEDAGVFNTATQETMQKRVIKKAKRHVQPASEAVAGAFSSFSGFSGANNNNSSFQLSTSPAKSPSALSFPKFSLSSAGTPGGKSGNVNGTTSTTSMVVSSKSDEGFLTRKSSSTTTLSLASVTPSTSGSSTASMGHTSGRNSDYYRKLKTLNTNVASWITLHVNKNPCCILTPIFRDYECYLEQLEKEYPSVDSVSRDTKTGNNLPPVPLDSSSPVKNSIPLYSKDKDSTAPRSSLLPPISNAFSTTGHTFSFGLGKGDADEKKSSPKKGSCVKEGEATLGVKEAATKANSLFGLQLCNTNTTSMNFKFGFGNSNLSSQFGSKPAASVSSFSFAVGPTVSKPADDTKEGEEEYVPPQAQGNEIIEEDAFYTKRCKLYYKKEDAFADRGVGILYLKKVDEKTQLVIRADNSIGTILLNIMLNSSISMQKTGKNNILFCCVPFPPINPKVKSDQPVMMMIRVKTEEDTNELLEKLQPTKA